jgi:tRNA/tmRNA/rRNA uracil-C5-methylase (TrmA/RlmC/RlmD family)
MTISTLTPKVFRRHVLDAARTGEVVAPICPHAPAAGMCGGCTFQDRSYSSQVDAKRHALHGLWAADLPAELLAALAVVPSPDPFAYRTRMDYVASKDRFGLRRGGKFNFIIDLDQCHLIPAAAFTAARSVYDHAIGLGLPDYNLRSHAGFLRYVVVRRSPDDQLLLAVVTAAPDADGQYEQALAEVAAEVLANPAVVGFHWLINDTLTDSSFGTPQRYWGAKTLAMPVRARVLQIGPNTFFQNNVHLLLPLLDDVAGLVAAGRAGTSSKAGWVADLYGGVGTIALHLADVAEAIVTVETVAESAALAQLNIAANQCDHITGVHAETLTYLRDQAVGCFETIVVDPPRTGLGPDVCRELLRLQPAKIVYVSCNALTQLDDARMLAPQYQIRELRGYDMFPQTPHLEALALFE